MWILGVDPGCGSWVLMDPGSLYAHEKVTLVSILIPLIPESINPSHLSRWALSPTLSTT